MATLREFSRRLKGLNLQKIWQQTIKETDEEIVELNIEQLEKGKTSKGKKIKPKYKDKDYAVKKKKLNPLPGMGTPDLKVSGSFYASIELKSKSNKFEFKSNTSKAKHAKFILPKYKDILGLDSKSQKKYLDETFYEIYMEKIRKQLKI